MDRIKGRGMTAIRKVVDWYEDRRMKRRIKYGADAIDNLQRLYRLKERGILTEDEFAELKEKMKAKI